MQYLLRKEIILSAVLCFCLLTSHAQGEYYLPDHETKPYYFGITLAYNNSSFHFDQHPRFLQYDSVRVAEPLNGGGFGLGLLATGRISPRFEVRFNPGLIFSNKTIHYYIKYPTAGDANEQDKRVESIYMTFPVQLKFRSDRINNFRVYTLGGIKYDYDLASNSSARKAEDLVKLTKGSPGFEAGLGFNFYFESFILSPEIKISYSTQNVHARDENLQYSNVIDRMQARMIVFSIHIEG